MNKTFCWMGYQHHITQRQTVSPSWTKQFIFIYLYQWNDICKSMDFPIINTCDFILCSVHHDSMTTCTNTDALWISFTIIIVFSIVSSFPPHYKKLRTEKKMFLFWKPTNASLKNVCSRMQIIMDKRRNVSPNKNA